MVIGASVLEKRLLKASYFYQIIYFLLNSAKILSLLQHFRWAQILPPFSKIVGNQTQIKHNVQMDQMIIINSNLIQIQQLPGQKSH